MCKLTSIPLGGHKGPVTGVAISDDSSSVYSCSKDNALIMWDVETTSKRFLVKPWVPNKETGGHCHDGELLAVAVSNDSKYVVAGGRDKKIRVFDPRTNAVIKVFEGHRGAITALSFRKGTNTLFSASEDRCLKQWDLNSMCYLDTLFGHQVCRYSTIRSIFFILYRRSLLMLLIVG